eukprot:PhF_6_TR4457/c0_g1_i2/m.6049
MHLTTTSALLTTTVLVAMVVCVKAQHMNQDGFGFSKPLTEYNPLVDPINMTAYNSWPQDLKRVDSAFNAGVYDGVYIWMVPCSANRVVRINISDGSMTGFNAWPAGFMKGIGSFTGGVYDGTSLWMVPGSADRVIRVNPNGSMIGYDAWPDDFVEQLGSFFGGVYDGNSIWMIPYNALQVVRINTLNGSMIAYNSWPNGYRKGVNAFSGGVFDGYWIWMIPSTADAIIRVSTVNGSMMMHDAWPERFTKSITAFSGGAYDGTSIWMIPSRAESVVRVDAKNGSMTAYAEWPEGFKKKSGGFFGCVYDGKYIWMVPSSANRVIRVTTENGTMKGYYQWPVGFKKGTSAFNGAVYDGTSVWMIPFNADSVIRLSHVNDVEVDSPFQFSVTRSAPWILRGNTTHTQTTPLTETIKTAALVSTAGGSMFITPSDVMITMQVLEVALCRNALGTSLRHPVFSLGRFVHPLGNADDKDNENETSMILVTIGLVYLLHGLLTVTITFMNTFTLRNWVTRVIHLRYPALSIRYHLSVALPMIATCTLTHSKHSSVLSSFFIFSVCSHFLILLLFSLVSCSRTVYKPLDDEQHTKSQSALENYLSPQGEWSPRISVAVGGLFFSNYTTYSYGRFLPSPYVWVWITMGVGVVMTLTTTLLEEGYFPQTVSCKVVAIVAGAVFVVSGCIHLWYMRVLMVIRGVCIVRGMRQVVAGLAMIVNIVSENHSENGFGYALTWGTILFSGGEMMIGLIVSLLKWKMGKTLKQQ